MWKVSLIARTHKDSSSDSAVNLSFMEHFSVLQLIISLSKPKDFIVLL